MSEAEPSFPEWGEPIYHDGTGRPGFIQAQDEVWILIRSVEIWREGDEQLWVDEAERWNWWYEDYSRSGDIIEYRLRPSHAYYQGKVDAYQSLKEHPLYGSF